jgi:hypothetical protein
MREPTAIGAGSDKKRKRSSNSTKKKATSAKGKSGSKRRTARVGARAALREVLPTTFFDTPRTINDVQRHLETKRALKFPVTSLSTPLGELVRSGSLEREKNADKVYEYVKPS